MIRWSPIILLPLLSTACATTTVTKNPDACDRGIRYYRPKPYLLIQPADQRSDEFVSISLQYLPDFSEEYSIRVRAGLGINETNVALKDGWNLTQISQKLDSQFDESIEAAADVIKALPIPTAAKARGGSEMKMVVRATNVPLGFYESVVSRGPDGKRQLCGWRYVGFQPFNACPGQPCASPLVESDPFAVFALVFDRGVMTFTPISQVEHGGNHNREILDRETVERLPPPDDTAHPALDGIRRRTLAYLRRTAWGNTLSLGQVAVRQGEGRTVIVTVRLTSNQRQAAGDDFAAAAGQLETQLLPDVRYALLDDGYRVRVEWAP